MHDNAFTNVSSAHKVISYSLGSVVNRFLVIPKIKEENKTPLRPDSLPVLLSRLNE